MLQVILKENCSQLPHHNCIVCFSIVHIDDWVFDVDFSYCWFFSFPSDLKKTTVVVESLSYNTTKCTVPENTSLLQDDWVYLFEYCYYENKLSFYSLASLLNVLMSTIKNRRLDVGLVKIKVKFTVFLYDFHSQFKINSTGTTISLLLTTKSFSQ